MRIKKWTREFWKDLVVPIVITTAFAIVIGWLVGADDMIITERGNQMTEQQHKELNKKLDYIITLLEEAEIARELGLDDDIYTEPLMLDDVR